MVRRRWAGKSAADHCTSVLTGARVVMATLHDLTRRQGHPGPRLGACVMAAALCAGGCATQAPYATPHVDVPTAWANAKAGTPVGGAELREDWWTHLGDPAIDTLVASALIDNP